MADAALPAKQVVEQFMAAIANRDFDRAMARVSRQTFEFVGPIKSYRGGQLLRQDLERLHPVLARLLQRRLFVDGNDVCVIYDLSTTVPGLELIRMAEWITVSDGQITRMEVFYDTHAYARLFDV